MAIVAFVRQPFEAADRSQNSQDYMLRFAYAIFDSDTGREHSESISVAVLPSDNATQIESKIRDALIQRGADLGWTVPVSNVFQMSIRRG
jgi:hypothetical protein